MTNEKSRTQSWHHSELCHVNGYGLVYRFSNRGDMEVMLPGLGVYGASRPVTLPTIKKFGWTISGPKNVRREFPEDSEVMG